MYNYTHPGQRKVAYGQLAKHYQDFHAEVETAISRVTGERIARSDSPPNEAIYDRLIAAAEPKKMEIIGTEERPCVSAIESHLKILKVDPNFLEVFERKKIEAEYNKKFNSKKGWRRSLHIALESGKLRDVAVELPNYLSVKRKRRNALVARSKRDFNPRAFWAMAIYKVLYAIREAKSNKIIDTVSDKSLVSQLREFQSRSDSMALAKIKTILELPTAYRTDEDLAFLNRILLSRLKSFARFSPEQRIQFCRVMKYEQHKAGSTIIKQGHKPVNFYFLFSGQCDVVKYRTDNREGVVRVHVLNSGDSFGAVALEGLVKETRTASVICTTESVFIMADKDEYRRIASGQDSEDQISLRISLLKNMNLFLECDPIMLEQVALKTRVTFHEQNAIILKEGQISSKLYFLAKGSILVSKQISIVKFNDRSKYIHYNPNVPLEKNQALINIPVIFVKRQMGDHFPEPDNITHFDPENDMNVKSKLLNRITFLEPRGLNLSTATFQCKTTVVTVDINILDFVKIVSTPIIQKFLIESVVFNVINEDLVKQFILNHNWENYKKALISDFNKNHHIVGRSD